MNAKSPFICSFVVLLCLLSQEVCSGSDAAYWENALAAKNLPEVAALAAAATGAAEARWPVIHSLNHIARLPSPDREVETEKVVLAEACLAKIKDFESSLQGQDATSSTKTYANLGSLFSGRGGYANAVLADTVYRLGLCHIAHFLVVNPDKFEEAQRMLDLLNVPFPDRTRISQLLAENVATASATLSGVTDHRIFGHIASIEKYNKADPGEFISLLVEKTPSLKLIREGDITPLLYRQKETALIASFHLPGLIEFLRLGGSLEDIRKGDEDKFKRVMGDRARDYRLPGAQFRRLDAVDVDVFLEQVADPYRQSIFYRMALESEFPSQHQAPK